MSTTFKQKNVVAAHARTWTAQSNLATALLAAALNRTLPLSRDSRPLPTIRKTREETRECRGKYLIGRQLTSRLALWPVRFSDVSAELVTGIMAMAMGDAAEPSGAGPVIHEITHAESDDVPKTTIGIGTEGDDDEPTELYKGMAVNRVVISGEVRGKVSMDVDFVGAANPAIDNALVFPACGTFAPIYTNDCQLLINAVDRTADLRRFVYTFDNHLLINDDPFPFNSVDAARIERDVEDSSFAFQVYGTKNHALYAAAAAESEVPITLRIGDSAEYASIIAAGAQLALSDAEIGYAGEANRSVINLDAIPFSVGGAAPDRVSSQLAFDDRFLVAPA